MGFAFGQSFPSLEWLTIGRATACRTPSSSMLLVAAVMWVVLHRSVFGRYLYAVGKNEEAARYAGVPTGKVIVAAYVICGVLTALAAIFFAMYTKSISPPRTAISTNSTPSPPPSSAASRLRGGEGSIIGVVLGAVLLQVLQNLVNLLGIPSSLNFAVMGSVILIGVIADQQFDNYRKRRALNAVTSEPPGHARPQTNSAL